MILTIRQVSDSFMSIRSSLTSKSMNVASYESSIFHISDLCSGSGLLGKAEILDFGSSILPVANPIDIGGLLINFRHSSS